MLVIRRQRGRLAFPLLRLRPTWRSGGCKWLRDDARSRCARDLRAARAVSYVALTRAGTIVPILKYLATVGVPPDEILSAAELPCWVASDPEMLIPGASPARLFRAAARHAGIPHLGLTAAEHTEIDALGLFGRLLRGAPTLGAALETAARYGTTMTANRPLRVRSRGDHVEFCMTFSDRFDPRDPAWQQDNLFCLGLMIGVVRLAAGPSWRPAAVHLWTDEIPDVRDANTLGSARFAFRQAETMITVPTGLLATRLPPVPRTEIPMDTLEEWTSSAPAREFVACIRQVIETLSRGDDYPTIQQTAQFLGVSVRTLQRQLATAGMTHDLLIAEARFTTATHCLAETDLRILDLALDLGYSDHANFTRAFRRWAGCSPQEYRKRHRRDSRPSGS